MGLFSRPKHDKIIRPSSWPVYGADITQDTSTPAAALGIVDVFACVRVLADTLSSIPLVAYRSLPNGDRAPFAGRLADLLKRPGGDKDPSITQSDLLSTLMGHLALWGNAFLALYRDDFDNIDTIAPIPPWQVSVRLIDASPAYQWYSLQGIQNLDSRDLIHFRGLSTDGIQGLSTITQAAQALGLATSLRDHATNFAANGGRPSGILRIPGWRGRQSGESQDTRSDWESRFATPANSGKVLIIEGTEDVGWSPLAMSLEDAQFIQQRQMSTEEIARLFRIPPWMIGAPIVERGITYATTEGQAQAFLKFTLTPWLTRIEQGITNCVDLSPSTVFAEFQVDSLLRADLKTRADAYTQALNPVTGWMTRQEVRDLETLPREETQWTVPPVDKLSSETPPSPTMPQPSTVNGYGG